MEETTGLVKAPRLCRIEKGAKGYGFNLHGEKGVLGQYISAVDAGSPAEKSGLSVGDRVIEVNETNVENFSHADVVKAIKEFPLHTTLLVIDRITDNYMKIKNLPITADFAKYSSVLDIPASESSTQEENKTNENDVQEKAKEMNEDEKEEKLQNVFSTVKIASDIEQVYDTPNSLSNEKLPESVQMTEVQADSVQQTEVHADSVQTTEIYTDSHQTTNNQDELVQTAETPVDSIETKENQADLVQVSDQTIETQPDLVKNSEDHDANFKTNNKESGDKSPVHVDSEEKFEILPENAITQFTNALENASPSISQKSSEIKKPLLSVIPQRKKVKETKDDWKAKQDLFNKL